ncbi:anti-sigma factor family protein [Myxococcus sp. Y35]|uniref:anti-sigma factor family protein n=1 Tax=Pseudomyxococcus flavus TaxID=3115648 RepID=UPI003CF11374
MEACSPAWQERLSAWFDGEVQAHEQGAVELHLGRCVGCAREAARYAGLRERMKAELAAVPPVPPELRARVSRLVPRAQPSSSWPRRVAGLAATVAVLGGGWALWPRGMNEALAFDLERHHLKTFSRTAPCEFESSDPSEVKAWVEREVGYSVEVPEVPGATLLGARRCELHGSLSASLQYRHGNKAMTLFLPPPGSAAARHAASFAGAGTRCTQGPVGERICVAQRGSEQVALAVSELEAPVLLDALASFTP